MAYEPQRLRPQDLWTWRQAQGPDVQAMVELTQRDFQSEADSIFTTDPLVYSHNLTRAIVDQFYDPAVSSVWIAHADSGPVVGYVWAERGQRAVWSRDEMVAIKIVHVDMNLPARQRLVLCDEMIFLWENWAASIGVPVICSTTMRGDQQGFLRLHQRRGYDVRGSIAYKRLATMATITIPA